MSDLRQSFTKVWHTKSYPALDPSLPGRSLCGKTAIIAGGSGSIGAATARAFCRAGISSVAIVGRREPILSATKFSLELEFPGTKVIAMEADITSKSSVQSAFAGIRDILGVPVDIFVNSTGYISELATVKEAELSEWWKAFEVNVKGSLHTIQALLPIAAANAVIINISSRISHLPPFPEVSAYAASKLAGLKLFDYVQSENPGLHVVSVHPGVIDSELNSKHGTTPEDHEDLPGSFNAWLCTPEAKFLKGKFVWANWDIEELRSRACEIEDSTLLTLTLDGWPFQY